MTPTRFLVAPTLEPRRKISGVPLKTREGTKTQVWLLNRMGGELNSHRYRAGRSTTSPGPPTQKTSPGLQIRPRKNSKPPRKRQEKDKPVADDAKSKKKLRRPSVVDRYASRPIPSDTSTAAERTCTSSTFKTKAALQVTSGDFDDEDPAWSPDGKQLAFRSNRSAPDPDRSTIPTSGWSPPTTQTKAYT